MTRPTENQPSTSPDIARASQAEEASLTTDDLPATERRHPASFELERLTTVEILELLNKEDRFAVDAVRPVLPAMAQVVDAATDRLRRGGRVHYFGAGTSGRLGILDAAELVPTFGIHPTLVQGHIAGGSRAIVHAVEDSEDDDATGYAEATGVVGPADVVIGITVAGTAAYVKGALEAARAQGAFTALITSNTATPLGTLCDVVLAPDTGPEILTGSTRLKAGTATKVLLNGFSTALMIRLGRTYSNLMVAVLATNQKLRRRTLRILGELTGADDRTNAELLDRSDGDLKTAVVSALAGVEPAQARAALERSGLSVRDAIDALSRAAG